MSVSGTAPVFWKAVGLSRPGILVTMLSPGLKPSLRLMSAGLMWKPVPFLGVEAMLRFTRRPVGALESAAVKWSLGQGNRQLVPGLAIVSQRAAFLRTPHCGTVWAICALELPSTLRLCPFPLLAVMVSLLAAHPASASRPATVSGRASLLPPRRSFTLREARSGPLRKDDTETRTFRGLLERSVTGSVPAWSTAWSLCLPLKWTVTGL